MLQSLLWIHPPCPEATSFSLFIFLAFSLLWPHLYLAALAYSSGFLQEASAASFRALSLHFWCGPRQLKKIFFHLKSNIGVSVVTLGVPSSGFLPPTWETQWNC